MSSEKHEPYKTIYNKLDEGYHSGIIRKAIELRMKEKSELPLSQKVALLRIAKEIGVCVTENDFKKIPKEINGILLKFPEKSCEYPKKYIEFYNRYFDDKCDVTESEVLEKIIEERSPVEISLYSHKIMVVL